MTRHSSSIIFQIIVCCSNSNNSNNSDNTICPTPFSIAAYYSSFSKFFFYCYCKAICCWWPIATREFSIHVVALSSCHAIALGTRKSSYTHACTYILLIHVVLYIHTCICTHASTIHWIPMLWKNVIIMHSIPNRTPTCLTRCSRHFDFFATLRHCIFTLSSRYCTCLPLCMAHIVVVVS